MDEKNTPIKQDFSHYILYLEQVFSHENLTETLFNASKQLNYYLKILLNKSTTAHITIVTQEAQAFKSEQLNLVLAPIAGLLRSLRLEYPKVKIQHIDFSNNSTIEQQFTGLMNEINIEQPKNEIVYREQRYLAQLNSLEPNKEIVSQKTYSAKATYIISGGLGGLGFEILKNLSQKGILNFITISRTPPSDIIQKQINQLKGEGISVMPLIIDITNINELESTIQNIMVDCYEIKGIIHAAGVIDDKLYQNMDDYSFERVMNPKIRGAWNLHQLSCSLHLKLDEFILCSSIAATFGSVGQSNYAYANVFLDALAYYRQSIDLPGLSLNLGPWAQTGMAKNLVHLHKSRGVQAFDTLKGLQVFNDACSMALSNIIIVDINWQDFLKSVPNNTFFFAKFSSYRIQEPSKAAVPDIYSIDNTKKSQETLCQILVSIVAKILKAEEHL